MSGTASIPQDASEVVRVSDDTLRGFAGYHMKRAFNVIQADLVKTLKPFELRMLTCTALILVVDNPGLRQSQLADAMDIERPNLVVIVDELERRDLITRDRSEHDRRAYSLNATPAGRMLCEKAVTALKAHEERLLRGLDDEAIAVMIRTLRIIETGVREV